GLKAAGLRSMAVHYRLEPQRPIVVRPRPLRAQIRIDEFAAEGCLKARRGFPRGETEHREGDIITQESVAPRTERKTFAELVQDRIVGAAAARRRQRDLVRPVAIDL